MPIIYAYHHFIQVKQNMPKNYVEDQFLKQQYVTLTVTRSSVKPKMKNACYYVAQNSNFSETWSYFVSAAFYFSRAVTNNDQ